MTAFTTRFRWSWAEFVGPGATRTNTTITLAAGAFGLAGSSWSARRAGAGTLATTALSALETDLSGAPTSTTPGRARWYERPGQGTAQHLRFAALHLHPFAIALADRSVGRRDRAIRWSVSHYGYHRWCSWWTTSSCASTATIRKIAPSSTVTSGQSSKCPRTPSPTAKLATPTDTGR